MGLVAQVQMPDGVPSPRWSGPAAASRMFRPAHDQHFAGPAVDPAGGRRSAILSISPGACRVLVVGAGRCCP
jgi:hypothetical protein